ncbi:tail fiber domain-containing protein [Cereibacter changlensis]|uniref:tail fiber domain-containing protein n=1 Tax=Cereibacter changlensis TaxID=402884 RepID=UPI0040344326
MGGSSAPKPDKNIGIAALKSAETGQMMLDWMQEQAKVTNGWAEEDRNRYTDTFLPLQDAYIADAKGYVTPERQSARAGEAAADVALAAQGATATRNRQAMAMGVNPASGRFASASAKAGTDTALATAGAQNLARRAVVSEGDAKMANAINLGSGLAVNPGTSMGLSNGAAQAGGNAAMQGYGQQGSLLNTQYQQQMQTYQANQSGLAGVMGAMGTVLGAIPFTSSKKVKHDKQPFDALGAVRTMPVEKWTYNEGAGDGGTHVGPYAEDFAKATGVGKGDSIDPITLMGVTMGAVRQLADKVDALGAPPRGAGRAPARAAPKRQQMKRAA